MNTAIAIDFTRHFRNLPKRERMKVFPDKKSAYDWIISGMRGCEGAERDHYVDLLIQLEDGNTTLYY